LKLLVAHKVPVFDKYLEPFVVGQVGPYHLLLLLKKESTTGKRIPAFRIILYSKAFKGIVPRVPCHMNLVLTGVADPDSLIPDPDPGF
jgi:hypothetical protein